MRQLIKIILPILYLSLFTIQTFAQNTAPSTATITFIAKDGDKAKTYIGHMKKGNIASLELDLQQRRGIAAKPTDNLQSQSSREGYVNEITSSTSKKNMKNRKDRAENDLIGHYDVKDTLDFEKIEGKKQKAIEKKYTSKKNPGFSRKLFIPAEGKKTSQLSNYYKVSKRRIRNGQTIKKQAGVVSFVVTYKIMENGFMNTYVNVVYAELIPGSAYYLKYHGSGHNRKYYLEYIPPTQR